MNTKHLDEHDKQLAANTYTLHYALRALWLELGRSATIWEHPLVMQPLSMFSLSGEA